MLASDGIIDTSILVDLLRGRPEAITFLKNVHAAAPLTTHIGVAAELLTGPRNRREQEQLDRFLRHLNISASDSSDCENALSLLRQHRLSDGIGWNDCLIAATAMRLDRAIITTNDKHFSAIPHLQVVRPY